VEELFGREHDQRVGSRKSKLTAVSNFKCDISVVATQPENPAKKLKFCINASMREAIGFFRVTIQDYLIYCVIGLLTYGVYSSQASFLYMRRS
jgi:hypothetical protein